MEATTEAPDTKDVSSPLSRLSRSVEQTDDHQSALTRLLELLEEEIEEEIGRSKATAILSAARHLHQEVGKGLVEIDACIGAIERAEHSA